MRVSRAACRLRGNAELVSMVPVRLAWLLRSKKRRCRNKVCVRCWCSAYGSARICSVAHDTADCRSRVSGTPGSADVGLCSVAVDTCVFADLHACRGHRVVCKAPRGKSCECRGRSCRDCMSRAVLTEEAVCAAERGACMFQVVGMSLTGPARADGRVCKAACGAGGQGTRQEGEYTGSGAQVEGPGHRGCPLCRTSDIVR
ncbi:uncharacterized protein T551_00775 [Pneumocystis jirovecii RU7]|uniref:Uncharacterized protein n=1 Tax=Pneumocystis jirovecii (strain RU7) TaxID=1408657 RepID=A0A0W4ZUN2_PNEJ7|nr:uncharacterized protein T551_00775 [Pneumocystis jirovecii RU7]KTW32093.1 hypothetical protein T551_00775 [Pneumocystis jirovecii RU7]